MNFDVLISNFLSREWKNFFETNQLRHLKNNFRNCYSFLFSPMPEAMSLLGEIFEHKQKYFCQLYSSIDIFETFEEMLY